MDTSAETETATHPAPAIDDSPRPSRRGDAVLAVAVLVMGCAVGAGGGWLWYRWWGPPGEGEVYDTDRGPLWLDPADQAMTSAFDATAQFVLVGAALGIVLGVVAALLGRTRPLVGLAAVCVASVLASFVAARVGFQLSPPDPQTLADEVEIGTRLPAGLVLSGWTPYLSWPIGALTGFLAVMLLGVGLGEVRRQESDPSTWLQPRG